MVHGEPRRFRVRQRPGMVRAAGAHLGGLELEFKREFRGRVVKASGKQSFGRQFEPYLSGVALCQPCLTIP